MSKKEASSGRLNCGHTLKEHQMMEEAKASSELEGARTDKTVCELIDMAENPEREMVEAFMNPEDVEAYIKGLQSKLRTAREALEGLSTWQVSPLNTVAKSMIHEAKEALSKIHE